jgi:hypothetical protein
MIYKKPPSAHAVTIERQPAIPEFYNNRNDPNTIQAEIEEEDIPEAIPFIPETEFITETKRTPSLFSPFGYTNKDIDINMSLFKNTCLKDIVLTDTEIGILNYELKRINKNNRKQFIKNNMPYYCDIRNLILSQMPDFSEKYPSLFSKVLSKCLETPRDQSFINTIVSLVTERNFKELNKRELFTMSHQGSVSLSLKLDKYKLTPTLLPKNKNIGGTNRKRKTKTNKRKNKKCKTRKNKPKFY